MFKYLLHGYKTLSLVSGIVINDLVVSCGCSFEKLPMIITNVITLFFGILPSKVIDELTMCTKTYQLAAERAMASMQADGVDRFVSNEYPDSPVAVCLCIDESNKGNKALVAKPYVARCNNGNIVLKALNTDIAMSKRRELHKNRPLHPLLTKSACVGQQRSMLLLSMALG